MEYNEVKQLIKRVLKIALWVIGGVGAVCIIALTFAFVTLTIWYFAEKPSKNKFDRRIEWDYFWNKDKNGECIIDLAETMNFEWDSLMHLPPNEKGVFNEEWQKLKPEEIYSDCYRIYFFKDGNIVYYADWYWYPYDYHPGGVLFLTPKRKFTIYSHDAKFKAHKKGSNGDKFLYLEKIE